MVRTYYLRKDNGNFAGSIGAGKTKTPTSSPNVYKLYEHDQLPLSQKQGQAAAEIYGGSDIDNIVKFRNSKNQHKVPSFLKTRALFAFPWLAGRWRGYRKNGAIVFAIRMEKGKPHNLTILTDMAVDPDWRCRSWAAKQPNLTENLAEILATDQSPLVRKGLCDNPVVADHIKAMISLM